MGREIKFKLWDLDKNVMIPPEDVINLDGELSKNLPKRYIAFEFTGLKDKKGVDIFEGDIILHKTPRGERQFVVEYRFGSFNVGGTSELCEEVLGNVYENPELLK